MGDAAFRPLRRPPDPDAALTLLAIVAAAAACAFLCGFLRNGVLFATAADPLTKEEYRQRLLRDLLFLYASYGSFRVVARAVSRH